MRVRHRREVNLAFSIDQNLRYLLVNLVNWEFEPLLQFLCYECAIFGPLLQLLSYQVMGKTLVLSVALFHLVVIGIENYTHLNSLYVFLMDRILANREPLNAEVLL